MKVKRIISTCGVLLGGLAMVPAASAVVTYQTSTDVQFTFSPTLSVALSGTSGTDFIIDDLMPGVAKNSNSVDVTVTTNNSTGYTLSAKVGNSTYNTDKLVRTSGTPATLDTDNTFDMTAGGLTTLAEGTWGYLINSGTVYGALTDDSDTTINQTTNASGTGATDYAGTSVTTMKIGAKATTTQVSGDYKNVINFKAVTNVSARTITIQAGTNVASVTPSSGSYNEGDTVNISATCDAGYEFSLWGVTPTIPNTSVYGSIANVNAASTTFTVGPSDATITAYCGQEQETIQDVTASKCTATPSVVTDSRDGQQYTIQRLADGNCWMMDNLNLGAVALTSDLTSSNTNLSSTVSASTFNDWEKSSGTSTYTAAELIPVSGTDSTSGTPYGTLYNFCAASAGTYCYSNSETTPDSAAYDLCPAGWRLPTGGSSGEFQALYNNASYNDNTKMRAPIANGGAAFALAGSFNDSTPTYQGSIGYYWSSTRNNNARMYRFRLNTSDVYPANYDSRFYGYSIRCILKSV